MVRGLWCVTLASLALFCASCARHERFVILSGSENETLEPLLRDFAHDHGIDLEMRYEGSIDIMAELQKCDVSYLVRHFPCYRNRDLSAS